MVVFRFTAECFYHFPASFTKNTAVCVDWWPIMLKNKVLNVLKSIQAYISILYNYFRPFSAEPVH